MKKLISTVISGLSLPILATAAHADDFVIQPVQAGYENIRYQQGSPTIDLRMAHGAVEIRPLPLDHGSLAFSVAILNASNVPVTIDIGNFFIKAGDQVLSPFSVDQLKSKAKNRAMWSQLGVSLVGALASGMAASERDTYSSSFSTPYGRYSATYSAPSLAGQIEANHLADETAMGVAAIQNQLDATRARLGDEIVQISTIDPGHMYAGKLVFQKLKDASLPQRITLIAGFNGDQYAFTFQLAKPGTPAPPITYVPPPVSSAPAPVSPQPQAYPSATPTLTPAAYHPPVSPAMPAPTAPIASFAMANRPFAGIGYGNSTPDMEQIVKRTAEVMPHPASLKDGTIVAGFAASGTNLVLTTRLPTGTRTLDDAGKSALAVAICQTRAFVPIIAQGGTVSAQYAQAGGKPVEVMTLNRAACGL